jgi:hypothetical protein
MKLRISGICAPVTVLLLAACSTPGQGPDAASSEPSDPSRIGYPTVEAALTAVRARPGVIESQQPDGWTVIEDKERRETWLFSPAGHPAHPAVVKRTVVKKFGDSTTQTAALCGSSKAECDKVAAQLSGAEGGQQPRQTGQPMGQPSRGGTRY